MFIGEASTCYASENFPLWCNLLEKLKPGALDNFEEEVWEAARQYSYNTLPPFNNISQKIVMARLADAVRERWPLFEIEYVVNGYASSFYIEQDNCYCDFDIDRLEKRYQHLYTEDEID